MKYFFLLVFGLLVQLKSISQTIVNTESMSARTDSTFVFSSSLEGNIQTGNIELVQINSSNQMAYRNNNNLLRFFFNYEFLSEGKETISSDYTTQLRYSYALKNNSLFSFIQGQKAVSLLLNSRYLAGFGYRHRIISKDNNYFDASFGPFYENETYAKNTLEYAHIINLRYSFSSFINFKISDKLQHNTAFYYQAKSNNLKDYRIYLEPKLIYDLDKFKIYTTLRYRYHATPYVAIKKADSQLLFGFSYEFGIN